MYVLPHWSFEFIGSGLIRIDHAITGERVVIPSGFLELLETLDAGAPVQAEAEAAIQRLKSSRLLFDQRSEAESWLQEHEDATTADYPTIDQIELTNRCPYTCVMCPRTTSMTRTLGDMSSALFERVLESLPPHQKYVGLHHFGESLLHGNLAEFVRRAGECGVATGLSCNPPSLKPQISERLLRAGLAEMVLSLDSLSAETYRQIRGPAADIGRARRHIAELVQLREALGAKTTITLQLILMRSNAEEAASFLQYCEEVGVDRGVVVHLGRWDFTDDKVSSLGDFRAPLYGTPCDRPRQSVVILWDGRVVPCCHDYDGAQVLGDLTVQSLAEIWASETATTFRQRWNETKLCTVCAFSRSFAESRRRSVGFRAFHRSRAEHELSWEYLRHPESTNRFDGFDVVGAR